MNRKKKIKKKKENTKQKKGKTVTGLARALFIPPEDSLPRGPTFIPPPRADRWTPLSVAANASAHRPTSLVRR
jgi:hypothetical protein